MDEGQRAGGAKLTFFPGRVHNRTGYTCGDLFLPGETTLGGTKGSAEGYCSPYTRGKDALIFVELPLGMERKLYHAVAVLHDGKILAEFPKSYHPQLQNFMKSDILRPAGKAKPYWVFDGRKSFRNACNLFQLQVVPSGRTQAGCEICEDIWAQDT